MREHIVSYRFVSIIGIIVFGLMGCESSKSTRPLSLENIIAPIEEVTVEPIGPTTETPPVESTDADRVQLAIPFDSPIPESFHAGSGYSDQIGVYYDGRSFFQAQMPPGDYALTYTTNAGLFYIVLRATANALITVGLNDNVVVYEAMLYRGTVTDTSYMYRDDPVIVYSEFGASGGWWNLFVRDGSPEVMLIGWVQVAYKPGALLTLVFPKPATYVLDYTTSLGTFRVEFQTTEVQETRTVFLQPGDEIWEAYLTVYD